MSAFNELYVDQLITRIHSLEQALKPFADKDECDIGFIIGSDEDHTENCTECRQVMFARWALKDDN